MSNPGVPAPGDALALALRVLLVSAAAFLVCFAIWMMFGVIGIPIRRELGLNASEFGLLTATSVLTGAVFRLPLGIWTDRFGGRIVMSLLLLACTAPLWLSSYATQLWQFLLLGLALGLVGGLGGFLLPILFGITLDWLGVNSSCFMLLYGIVWVSLILIYITEVRQMPVMSMSRFSLKVDTAG